MNENVKKKWIMYGLPHGLKSLMNYYALYETPSNDAFPPKITQKEHGVPGLQVDVVSDTVQWKGYNFKGMRSVRNALWLINHGAKEFLPLNEVRVNENAIVWGSRRVDNWRLMDTKTLINAIRDLKRGWSTALDTSLHATRYRVIERSSNVAMIRVENDDKKYVVYRGVVLGDVDDFEVTPFTDTAKNGMRIVGEEVISEKSTHVLTNAGRLYNTDRDSEEYELLLEYARRGYEVKYLQAGEPELVKRIGNYTLSIIVQSRELVLLDLVKNVVFVGEAHDADEFRTEKDVWKLFP